MAIYHLNVKTGSTDRRAIGQGQVRLYRDVKGSMRRTREDLANTKNPGIMPEWAEDDPRKYWEAADERASGPTDGCTCEVEFALPRELNERERRGGGLELC